MESFKKLNKLIKEIGYSKIANSLGYKTDITIRQWENKGRIPQFREDDLAALFNKTFANKKKPKAVIRKNLTAQVASHV